MTADVSRVQLRRAVETKGWHYVNVTIACPRVITMCSSPSTRPPSYIDQHRLYQIRLSSTRRWRLTPTQMEKSRLTQK